MPTASTVASIVVALAAIAVVVRWPRPRADRRVLERRAHGLEVLGTVVTRSAANRAAAVEQHLTRQPTTPAEVVQRPTAITVLGPGDPPPRTHPSTSGAHPRPPAHPSPAATPQVVQLAADDLPPDDDLAETVDGLSPSGDRSPWGEASTPLTAGAGGGGRGRAADGPRTSGGRAARAPQPAGPLTPVAGGRRRPAARRVAVVAAALLVVLGGVALTVARPDSGLMPNAAGGSAEAASSPPDPPTPDPTADPAPPPPLTPRAITGDVVAFDLTSPFTLDLAAGAATWVRVQTTGGEILFEGTLAPTDTTSVSVTEPLQLRVGNPAGLLVAADGQFLDHPRQSGQPLTLALG